MAGIRLNPPEQFDFSKPDEWPKWKKRFEQYRSASGLKAEEDPRQVDTLLYCMGEEADSVLASTHISAEGRKKYDAVVGKFDAYFKVRRNTIFERARFNRRCHSIFPPPDIFSSGANGLRIWPPPRNCCTRTETPPLG